VSNKDIKYWVGFSIIPGIGRVKLAQLENYFSNLEDAWKATPADLKHAGLDSSSINAITSWRAKIYLEAEMEKLDRYGVEVLTWHDPNYPARLKGLSTAPLCQGLPAP
jgi:DNA processing protein